MAKKKTAGRKLRVEFRQNRQPRRRGGDLTRRLRDDEERVLDTESGESVQAKGALSRKRTILVDDADAPLIDESRWQRGIVTLVYGRICRVEDESGRTWDCTVRRILRTRLIEQRAPVTVGDFVWFSDQSAYFGDLSVGVVERVEPRRTVLSRSDRRGREHTVVANADQLVIVTSVAQPRPKPHLIDRYLVAAAKGDLRPIVVFNKCDLLDHPGTDERGDDADTSRADSGEADPCDAAPQASNARLSELDFEDERYAIPAMTLEELMAEYRMLGYAVLRTSALQPDSLSELRRQLHGRVSIVAGQSGVGKTSLINAIQPGLDLAVRDVSEATEKGRHTTTLARLLRLDGGGYLVDTPGVRQFGLWNVEPGELEACFVELAERAQACRFKDCHHAGEEPGCAVRDAVERGQISPRRYQSYQKMLHEAAAERKR